MRDFTVTLPSDAMGKLLATLIGETARLRENAARATALGVTRIAEEDTARAEALSVAIGCLYRAQLSRHADTLSTAAAKLRHAELVASARTRSAA